nr:(-)-germacrene D synthase-like [Ipomoea batatas]
MGSCGLLPPTAHGAHASTDRTAQRAPSLTVTAVSAKAPPTYSVLSNRRQHRPARTTPSTNTSLCRPLPPTAVVSSRPLGHMSPGLTASAACCFVSSPTAHRRRPASPSPARPRFDTSASNEVPQYLKKVYLTILATTTEMEEVMAKENKLFHVAYAIGEMKKSVRAYHQEFIWFYTKHVPTFEEYLKVSFATTCYMTLATTSLVGMGDIVTKEVLDWITSEPLAIKANCSICRLMDDIIGHEFEQERGHVVSAVECYTKEYNVSEQEAYVEIENLISKAWKDLNQECLHPTPVPMKVLLRIMNLARVIFLLYKDKDNYTFSQVKLNAVAVSFKPPSVCRRQRLLESQPLSPSPPSLLCSLSSSSQPPRLAVAVDVASQPYRRHVHSPRTQAARRHSILILVVFPKKEPLRSKVGMGDGIAMAHQAQAIVSNIEFLIWSE